MGEGYEPLILVLATWTADILLLLATQGGALHASGSYITYIILSHRLVALERLLYPFYHPLAPAYDA
ncbi:hypothetical protein [Salipaludibacillus aurantiacus]|uniref:hypothetical protein n=1 Tax=Salipaludibacillus aurantiacus TaxID=1601833 RepID=UPI00115F87FB|nr:hypothetical protein [Salipaludibacillus aurantiacus]